MTLLDRGLACDALVSVGVHFWRVDQSGLGRSEFAIERVSAPVGLTRRLGSVASLRASCDIGLLQPQDLYVDLHWPSGFGVRAGQFKLPVGVDQLTNPEQTKLANGPLLVAFARPFDVRDIGLSGTWTRERIGPNTEDNNDRKDLCARVVVKPWFGSGVELAARGYYGWPDSAKVAWRTAAVEVVVERARLSLRTEIQNLESARLHNNSGYLQVAYAIGVFEPVCRLDLVHPRNRRVDFMATGGFNLRPLGDNLKVMFDGSYRRDYQGNLSVFGFLLRLQATI